MKLVCVKSGSWHAYVFGPLGHWHLVATGRKKAEAKANAAKTPEGKEEVRCGR